MLRIVLLVCLLLAFACSPETPSGAKNAPSAADGAVATTRDTAASPTTARPAGERKVLSQDDGFTAFAAGPPPNRPSMANFAVLDVPEEKPEPTPKPTTTPGVGGSGTLGLSGIGSTIGGRPGRWRAPRTKRLSMESLDVQVEVMGRLARTQVTQVFRNHHPWQTEGTYAFTLPEGAAISRLAMDVVPGKLMEGELVERERARQVYEGIVRKMKDPALLEWQGGNRFSTQIFPIPGNGTKTVVLAYEQMLPSYGDVVHFQYGLPHLVDKDAKKRLGAFRFKLVARDARPVEGEGYALKLTSKDDGTHHLDYAQKAFAPAGPLRVTFRGAKGGQKTAVAHASRKDANSGTDEHFFMLDWVDPATRPAAASPPKSVVFALDTSAGLGVPAVSRAKDLIAEVARKLPPETTFHVLWGDMRLGRCSKAPMKSGDAARLKRCLDALDGGGATDLAALLREAVDQAAKATGRAAIVWFSDGIPSLGEVNHDRIAAGLRQGVGSRDVSLHAVAVGHHPDRDFMRRLVNTVGGRALRLRPSDAVADVGRDLLWGLAQRLLTHVRVSVLEGAVRDLVPATPKHLLPGEPLPVLGRLDSPRARLRIVGNVGGKEVAHDVTIARGKGGVNPLIPGFWARGRIGDLERGHVDRKAVVGMSLKYGVMSRYTSFLVLENDKAYETFGVKRLREGERQAGQGLAPLKLTLTDAEKRKQRARDMAADMGVLSVIGGSGELSGLLDVAGQPGLDSAVGGGGGSSGVMGGRGYMPPRGGRRFSPLQSVVIAGPAKVAGGLDRRVVQRVIRRYLGSFRGCHNRVLTRNPRARDKLTVSLAVTPKGRVIRPKLADGRLKDRRLKECLLARMKRWRFPEPKGGGSLAVSFPLTLKTRGGDPRATMQLEMLLKAKRLSERKQGLLLDLLINRERESEADQRFAAIKKQHEEAGTLPSSLFDVLSPFPVLRERYGKDLEKAAQARMTTEPEPAATVLWELWAKQKQLDRLAKQTWPDPPLPLASRRLQALAQVDVPKAKAQFAAWVKQLTWSPKQQYEVLTHGNLPETLAEVYYAVTKTVMVKMQDPTTYGAALVDAALASKRARSAARVLVDFCTFPSDLKQLDHCMGLMDQLKLRAPETGEVKAGVEGEMVAIMGRLRQQDVANIELIKRQSKALDVRGDKAAASRMWTELVEFTPREWAAREAYATYLEATGDVVASCRQLATGLHLNPTKQRKVYQAMTNLRRRQTKTLDAKAFRECVLDAVSRYPVQRNVAVVVTWEAPDANVDLLVTEADGEEVRRGHRESKQGGQLVNVSDYGFGPEIYELGGGAPGTYQVKLRRDERGPDEIRGEVIVIKAVGSPKEVRTSVSFVLKKAASKAKPVTTFQLEAP